MNNREDNWFVRNRRFIFGFAVVVAILNIAILLLVPQQRPVSWTGETTEYAVDDESFAETRTVALEGTLTSSVIGGTRFDGTLTISGYDELDDLTLHLTRRNKRWEGNFNTAAGQPTTTVVHEVYGTKDFDSLMVDLWSSVTQSEDGRWYYSMDFESAHFLALGSETRAVALRQYLNYVPIAQN